VSSERGTVHKLTKLESEVLERLIAGGGQDTALLRLQLDRAVIEARTLTGVGFFVDFTVPDGTPKLALGSSELGGVNAELRGAKHDAGFMLFMKDGYLSTLEGFTYDEPWPSDADEGYVLSGAGWW